MAEHYALKGTEFAGVVLISGFTDVPNLLISYSIGGWIPILSPLKVYPRLQKIFRGYVVDKWPSITRLANFVRVSNRVRLFIIHARDDHEIPYANSDRLFAAAANATTSNMSEELLITMKARNTVDMGNGAFMSTWNSGDNKIIREQVVAHGGSYNPALVHLVVLIFSGHNRVMTYAPVALAALQAFGITDGTL